MGETGWRLRIGENAIMVELLVQNTASANGNSFISCDCSVMYELAKYIH